MTNESTADSELPSEGTPEVEYYCFSCKQPIALEHGCQNDECVQTMAARIRVALQQTPFRVGI